MSLEDQPKIKPSTDREWMEYYRKQLAIVARELTHSDERKRHYRALLGEERKKSVDARMQDASDFMTAMVLKQKMIIVDLENKVKRLQEAVVTYGDHRSNCNIQFIPGSECTCGFSLVDTQRWFNEEDKDED